MYYHNDRLSMPPLYQRMIWTRNCIYADTLANSTVYISCSKGILARLESFDYFASLEMKVLVIEIGVVYEMYILKY